MKKTILILFLILASAAPAWALSSDGRTDMGPLARSGYVIMRGVGNLAGSPMEIPGTIVREHRMHPWLWPLTWPPRLFTNVGVRITSIVTDVAFFPVVAPFTDDLSPVTEAFDLPEYPWQND